MNAISRTAEQQLTRLQLIEATAESLEAKTMTFKSLIVITKTAHRMHAAIIHLFFEDGNPNSEAHTRLLNNASTDNT